MLTQGGLTNRDVEWVFTDSAVDAANVFKAGKVDAAVSWSPDVYVAARERQGGHILASTKEASNLIADIFVARGDFLEKHPEDARRFVAGWLKGVEMVEKNPERAAVLLQKSLSGVNTLEDAKAMLEDVKLPDYAENRAFFNPQGSIVNYHSIYQTAQNIWRKIGKISRVYPGYQTVDTRFLEGAAEFFPARRSEAKPEFEFKTPPTARARSRSSTKTVSIFFPTGSSDRGRERQGGARHAGRGPGRHLRQRLHAHLRQHRQRGQPRREPAALAGPRRRRDPLPGLEGVRPEQVRGGGQRPRQAGGQQRHRRGPGPEPAHRLRGDPAVAGPA